MVNSLFGILRGLLGMTEREPVKVYRVYSPDSGGDDRAEVLAGKTGSATLDYGYEDWSEVVSLLLPVDADEGDMPVDTIDDGYLELLASVFDTTFAIEKIPGEENVEALDAGPEADALILEESDVITDTGTYTQTERFAPVVARVETVTVTSGGIYGLPKPLGDFRNYMGRPSMVAMVGMYGRKNEDYILTLRTTI